MGQEARKNDSKTKDSDQAANLFQNGGSYIEEGSRGSAVDRWLLASKRALACDWPGSAWRARYQGTDWCATCMSRGEFYGS